MNPPRPLPDGPAPAQAATAPQPAPGAAPQGAPAAAAGGARPAPADDARGSGPTLHEALVRQQHDMVLAHTRLGVLMASAFAVLLALSLRGVALQTWIIDLWLGVKLAVAAVRIVSSLRHAHADASRAALRRQTTDLWLLVDGAVWGTAGLLLMASPIPLASLVASIMVCVSCVATFGLQHSLRATAAYVAPILLLTTLGLYLREDEFGFIGGSGVLMLLALLLMTARGSQRRLAEGLELRLQAQALGAEKQEALERAMRESAAKTQFIGSISHELRTPLHGILGVARLLHLQTREPALRRQVELIESSGMHLLRLINDLLEVARLDAGRFTVRRERFDLAELLRTLAEVYAVRAGDAGLTFTMTTDLPQACWVQGDPARVRQVLHNLLGNAVKFTRQGSVAMHVSRDAGEQRTRIAIVDTGPGIGAPELQTVFDAFRQGSGRVPRPLEGTGLGLFVARDIARAMGGDLELKSELGVGTTSIFTASFPDAPLPAPQEAAQAAQHPQLPAELRVLLAEDDEVNSIIASAFLERLGILCERVRDGEQAVRHALRDVNRPDLVLMDCRMPGMDGLTATRKIRAQELALGLPRLPIIALTANEGEQTRADCRAAGMDGFLGKPYMPDELARALRDVIAPREPLLAS